MVEVPQADGTGGRPSTGLGKGYLTLVIGVVALVTVWSFASQEDGTDSRDGQATVEDVRKVDTDDSYRIVGPARVQNDAGEGWLYIAAQDVGWRDNRTPRLTSTVHYDSGAARECEMRRAYMWGRDADELQHRCGTALALEGISHVTVGDG